MPTFEKTQGNSLLQANKGSSRQSKGRKILGRKRNEITQSEAPNGSKSDAETIHKERYWTFSESDRSAPKLLNSLNPSL